GFQQRLWNVLGVLVAPRPLAQTRRTNILVRREFEFLHGLLERCDDGDYWPDGLRFAPVGISASLCHNVSSSCLRGVRISKKQSYVFDSIGLILDSAHIEKIRARLPVKQELPHKNSL